MIDNALLVPIGFKKKEILGEGDHTISEIYNQLWWLLNSKTN